MRDTNLTHFSETSTCGYSKISSIVFAFTIDTYTWLSGYLLQKYCVLLLFVPSKYVYPLEDSIFDLKENWTLLGNFATIFLALGKENHIEEHSSSPAIFYDAIGIIQQAEFGAC